MTSRHMRRAVGWALVLALVFSACGKSDTRESNDKLSLQLKKARGITGWSISIRNGAERFVEYTVKPADTQEPPEHRILDTGEIDTFAGGKKITVTFFDSGEVARQELEPGKTYSFIRDEQGELSIKEGWHGLEWPPGGSVPGGWVSISIPSGSRSHSRVLSRPVWRIGWNFVFRT